MRERTKFRCRCCWPGRGRYGKKLHARIVRRRARQAARKDID